MPAGLLRVTSQLRRRTTLARLVPVLLACLAAATLLAAGCLAAGSTPDADPGATPADTPPPGVQGMRSDRSDPLPPPAPAGSATVPSHRRS